MMAFSSLAITVQPGPTAGWHYTYTNRPQKLERNVFHVTSVSEHIEDSELIS